MHILHKLVKHNLIRGLAPYNYEKEHVYSAFVKVKQVQASFKSLKRLSTSRHLELLHMDLCGPTRIRILGESSHIFIRVGDYSKFIWVISLKDKPEGLKEFIKFCRKFQISKNLQVS